MLGVTQRGADGRMCIYQIELLLIPNEFALATHEGSGGTYVAADVTLQGPVYPRSQAGGTHTT
jgi:hypothetical protein